MLAMVSIVICLWCDNVDDGVYADGDGVDADDVDGVVDVDVYADVYVAL